MKTISYRISIPEPCHEDWNAMLPEEKGRFCLACQKTVTDFSWMNDEGIVDYLQNHTNLCGRFAQDQLNRPISAQIYQHKTTTWWQAALFAAFALFANRTVALPHYKSETTNQQPFTPKHAVDALVIEKGPDKDTTEQVIVLKGKVIDFTTNDSLTGAQILVYQDGVRIAYTSTDSAGRFEISVRTNEKLVLVCTCFGCNRYRLENIFQSDTNILAQLNGAIEIKGGKALIMTGDVMINPNKSPKK